MVLKDLVISSLISFAISGFIAIILKVIGRIHNVQSGKNRLPNDEIKDSKIDGFDDEIIKIASDRINQELHLSSSSETKAGVLMGAIGIIFSILFTNGIEIYFEIIKETNLMSIPLIIGLTFLIVSFVAFSLILKPGTKLILPSPRKANNEMTKYSTLEDVKKELKKELIKISEETRVKTEKDVLKLIAGFHLFWIGMILISIPIIYSSVMKFLT